MDDTHDTSHPTRRPESPHSVPREQGEERKEAQSDVALEEGQRDSDEGPAKDATSLLLQQVHALGARDITKVRHTTHTDTNDALSWPCGERCWD
jgi:hypothetical protein